VSPPRLLLTGATGFIGRQVLPLLADDIDLHVVSNQPSPALPRSAQLYSGDLRDPETCRRFVERVRPTHLLHLAWSTEHGVFWSDIGNVDWMTAGIALLRAFGVCGGRRAIVMGTCAEYAPNISSPLDEVTTPLAPESLYGAMKLGLFKAGTALAEQHGFSFAWPRLFHCYGAGEKPARLVPSTILALLAGKPARCANPDLLLDFTDVRDLGAATHRLLLSDLSGPINFGSGDRICVADLVALLESLILGKPLPERGRAPTSALVPDLRRMHVELGYSSRIMLRAGLTDAIGQWRHHANCAGAPNPAGSADI